MSAEVDVTTADFERQFLRAIAVKEEALVRRRQQRQRAAAAATRPGAPAHAGEV